jgi:hypothetical protein
MKHGAVLLQAAATSPAWQHQLATMPAATVASVLAISSSRYSRLQQAAACRQQARRTMRGLLCMSGAAFEAFAGKHLQQQQQQQSGAAAGVVLAEGLEAKESELSIAQMQLIADGLAVAPAKITVNPIIHSGSSSSGSSISSTSSSSAADSSSTASGSTITGIRLRYSTADVSLRQRALTHDTLLEGLVRLCCCWSLRTEEYHLNAQQCAAIRAYVPAAKWEMFVVHCKHPRMLAAA